jgi:hypothetical protein
VEAAASLSLAHVGGLAVAGFCVVTLFDVALPRSWPDRLAVSYLAGWGAVPVLALVAHAAGGLGWAVPLTLVGLGGAALGARLLRGRPRPGGDDVPAGIPPGAYLLALGYVVVSVALPFSRFSADSIVRELYLDGVQRFGAAYALAEGVPPANPFVAGAPLHYYWFFLVPPAAEYRLVHGDLFAVWKCAQTWTAMLLLPGLWSLLQAAFRSRAVAWAALLFGFVFASWEMVASRQLAHALAAGLTDWGALASRMLVEVFASDPDMRVGLITPYSDQLFMEDFVYVPQNAAALIVTLLALRYGQAGRPGLATFTLSSLAGFNTFLAIPAYVAFTAMHAMRAGLRAAALVTLALGAWSLLWLRICGILDTVPLLPAGALAVLAAVLLRRRGADPPPPPADDEPGPDRWLRPAAWACLVALALVVTLRPGRNAAALVLNYGPGLGLGLVFVARLAWRRSPTPAGVRPGALFFLVAGAVSALVTWLLYLQFVDSAPPAVQRLSAALGLEVNLFNFHHKAWKLSRLGWAVLAGVLLHDGWPRWRARLAARPALRIAIGAALAVSALAGLVRPFTYLADGPVAEGAAAGYLRRHGRGLATRVLLEDFRESRLNMLAPVSAFYLSSWSGGNPGLTHRVGTWADQYLPPRARPESARREALTRRFFDPGTSTQERGRILREERIDYVLTRVPHDLAPVAALVAEERGGYLYRVRPGPGG